MTIYIEHNIVGMILHIRWSSFKVHYTNDIIMISFPKKNIIMIGVLVWLKFDYSFVCISF